MFYNCRSAPSNIIPIHHGREAWFSATTLVLVEYDIDSNVVIRGHTFNLSQRVFPIRNWIKIDPHYNQNDEFWLCVNVPYVICVNIVQTFNELRKEERFDETLIETIKRKLLEFGGD